MKRTLLPFILAAFVCPSYSQQNASLGAKSAAIQPMIHTDLTQYNLVWSDEFEGDTLAAHWNLEKGYIANQELQTYTQEGNYELSQGTLKIRAIKENNDKVYGSYTSARLNTQGHIAFTHGRIEARMKLPQGVGVWPAFWMLGENIRQAGWPACGEIDIMEYVGYEPTTIHATLHSKEYNHRLGTQRGSRTKLPQGEDVGEWHTYGIIWSEKGIDFYLDSPDNCFYSCLAPEVRTASAWPFDAPHFLILNLAIGGSWGGAKGIDNTIFPALMEIDYVRVYQPQK